MDGDKCQMAAKQRHRTSALESAIGISKIPTPLPGDMTREEREEEEVESLDALVHLHQSCLSCAGLMGFQTSRVLSLYPSYHVSSAVQRCSIP